MSHVSEVSRVFPEPPFAPELISDFHAGAPDDDLAAHVQAELAQDPGAQELLAALDATVAELRGLPAPEVVIPVQVRAATEATLVQLGSARADRPARHTTGLLIAAAVLAVLAGGILVAQLMSPARPVLPDAVRPVASADTASLLAAVRGPQVEALDANRLARCLTAHRLGGVGVVGAGYLVYQGRPAQVILTPTGRPGQFNALVTTRDCDAGKPGTIARAIVAE